MDVLADLLRRTRARDGVFSRSVLRPPWALRFADHAALSIELLVAGQAHVRPEAGPTLRLEPGDVAIVRGNYVLADEPSTPVGAVIYGPGRAAAVGEPVSAAGDRWRLDTPRSYGERTGSTEVIRSAYQVAGTVGRRLLDAVPAAARVPAADLPAAARELLAAEIHREDPGQSAVLDRLLDLLLVLALRAWFADPAQAPPWYRAQADGPVARALQLLHAQPARRWTVPTLAAEVGLSRATLARRFTDRLGESPMSYLARWRVDLAVDLLAESDAPLAAIARRVGYADGYGLSAAVKRETGRNPSEHRHPPDQARRPG